MKMATFTAVGMRFRGNHVFTPEDNVTLQREDENPHDPNAVKILVGGRHVAYVSRDDCPQVRAAISRGRSEARFVENYPQSACLALV